MALSVGRELFINMRMSYSKQTSPACVLYHGGEEETLCQAELGVVSCQCLIGNMKTQQEATLKHHFW